MARTRTTVAVSTREQAHALMMRGVWLLTVGLVITIGTFMVAPGGIAIVAFGPIIFGFLYIVKGASAKGKLPRA